MSKSDEQKFAAMVRKNAAKAEKAKSKEEGRYDDTLQPDAEDDPESHRLFSDMKKREF